MYKTIQQTILRINYKQKEKEEAIDLTSLYFRTSSSLHLIGQSGLGNAKVEEEEEEKEVEVEKVEKEKEEEEAVVLSSGPQGIDQTTKAQAPIVS